MGDGELVVNAFRRRIKDFQSNSCICRLICNMQSENRFIFIIETYKLLVSVDY